MYFQSIEGGELFPFHGEPTPGEIHALYQQGQRVATESYLGEIADIYRANDRRHVDLPFRVGSFATNFIMRHEALKLRSIVVGPTLYDGKLYSDFVSLWVPQTTLKMV